MKLKKDLRLSRGRAENWRKKTKNKKNQISVHRLPEEASHLQQDWAGRSKKIGSLGYLRVGFRMGRIKGANGGKSPVDSKPEGCREPWGLACG